MKKTDPENRAKKAAAAINQVRVTKESFSYNIKTKKDELVDMLRKCGCPYPHAVASSLVNHELVNKTDGLYTFKTNIPVHFSIVRSALDKAARQAEKKNKKYMEKLKTQSVTTDLDNPAEVKIHGFNTENDIIAYLKSKGYRILRPVTNFEEC